jgi:hypothetical protein
VSLSRLMALTASGRKPGQGRRRACLGETRVPGRPARMVQYLAERGLPALAERRDAQRATHLPAWMAGQIQQAVDLGDGHVLRPGGQLDDVLPGLHLALGQDAEVKAGPVTRNQEGRNAGIIQPDAHPEAGDPGLGYLENSPADLVPVADAHLIVGQAVHREVLSELPVAEVGAIQLVLPVPVRADLVDEHGPLFAAMPGQVPLPVPIDVEPPHHLRAGHRRLPHGGVHRPALPGHIARHPDVNRQQTAGSLR